MTHIIPLELLKVLQKIEERGAMHTAHRMQQIVGQVFRYAVATGRAERDITADLRGALTMEFFSEKPRQAVQTSTALKPFIYRLSEPFAKLCKTAQIPKIDLEDPCSIQLSYERFTLLSGLSRRRNDLG